MKSLWKISRRYVCSAILVTVFIIYANLMFFLYYGIKNMNDIEESEIGRDLMEYVVDELSYQENNWCLSKDGYDALADSSFIWAMLLDENGDVAWCWQLPTEFPMHYSVGDVASFSRWYLQDYPVRTWRNGDCLMVFGMEQDSVTKFNAVYDIEIIRRIPDTIKGFLISNVVLILLVAIAFAYRFYRAMKPLASGIDSLTKKEVTTLREKGLMSDLAMKLNQTSTLLKYQDEKLAQRDEARTSWIAGVSHDIRTPLTLITGYADELAREEGIPSDAKKKAQIICKQSLVIKELVSDLNLTSKLEYQAQPLKRSDFSPAGLLRSCVAEYYNQGMLEGYEIEVDIEEAVEQVRLNGDTGLLLRAFRNLIGNSMRHNSDGCVVMVKLMCWQDGVRFVFADTGVGIPERVVQELEEEKTKQGTTCESSVHIMGLRIVCQIIKAHGWNIEFVKRECGTYDVAIRMG